MEQGKQWHILGALRLGSPFAEFSKIPATKVGRIKQSWRPSVCMSVYTASEVTTVKFQKRVCPFLKF